MGKLKFCANISTLFHEAPVLERFRLAKKNGFNGIEFIDIYTESAEELSYARKESQIEVVNFNAPGGNRAAGDLGFACVPGREQEFKDSIIKAIHYAGTLNCKNINILAGKLPLYGKRSEYLEVLKQNLIHAAGELAKHGIFCTLEAINTLDRPGYILATTHEVLEIVSSINHPNLGIEADIFHMGRMNEDVVGELIRSFSYLRHVQFADSPSRQEPGTGTLDFNQIFNKLEELNYRHWISAEYHPSKATEETLEWYKRFK